MYGWVDELASLSDHKLINWGYKELINIDLFFFCKALETKILMKARFVSQRNPTV